MWLCNIEDFDKAVPLGCRYFHSLILIELSVSFYHEKGS